MSSGLSRSVAEGEARRHARRLQQILGDYVEEIRGWKPPGFSPKRGLRPRHVPPEFSDDPVVGGLVARIKQARIRVAWHRRHPPPSVREMLES